VLSGHVLTGRVHAARANVSYTSAPVIHGASRSRAARPCSVFSHIATQIGHPPAIVRIPGQHEPSHAEYGHAHPRPFCSAIGLEAAEYVVSALAVAASVRVSMRITP
jgi:hypothetical protein